MKYLKKFESNLETDNEFVVSKIVQQFPFEDVKQKIQNDSDETDKETALIDMICWFEDTFSREIENEDYILDRLRQEYDLQ